MPKIRYLIRLNYSVRISHEQSPRILAIFNGAAAKADEEPATLLEPPEAELAELMKSPRARAVATRFRSRE